MILTPWSDAELDQREALCYALVDKALRAMSREAVSLLDTLPPVAAPEDEPEPDLTGAEQAALAAWGIFVQTELQPFISDTFMQGAELVVDGLSELVEMPHVGNSAAEAYLATVHNRLVGIGENMWKGLRSEILHGFRAGEGIPEIAARLMEYAGLSESRSRTVARTEVIGAANAGSYLQVLDSGLDGTKSWLATEDERTRKSHNHADNQTVRLTDEFSVEIWKDDVLTGHDMMLFPGDPTATASNVINCRCTPSFEFDDDDLVTASAVPLRGIDKRTGRPVAPNKPIFLRVKALFETDYPDGAVIAVRPETGESLAWDAWSKSVIVTSADGTTSATARGAVMALRKDEEGWRTPSFASGTPRKVSAPTAGKPINLRVKALYQTVYTHGEIVAQHADGRTVTWDAGKSRMRLGDEVLSRSALYRRYRDEDGWMEPEAPTMRVYAAETLTAAAEVHTGAMIALVPSEADLDRLQADEPREILHLTLAFLGEAEDISPADRERIIMATLPYFTEPITTEASSVMVLNPHTPNYDTALVLGIRGMDLVEPRENVMSAVRGVYPFEETFKPWMPHVTMAYTDDLGKVADYVSNLGPITFDTLRFAFGGEVIDITLSDEMLTAASRLDPDLRKYWLGPKGSARVGGWGNPGSFTACQREMRKEGVPGRMIDGLCANLYRAATGRHPGEKKEEHSVMTAAFATPKYAEWEGVITLEGTESGDGRMFNLGALDWAQLPQPLMYQPANTGGHDGSVLVGKITSINRQGNLIYGTGLIDLATSEGPEVYRLMSEEMLNGVSVDVDSVHDADIEMTYDPGTLKPRQTRFKRGRVRGATLVAFPAFDQARIYLNGNIITASGDPADGDENEVLVAASHTITIPDLPPAAWFQRPSDVKLSGALTVTDEGRVYGLLAPKNTTHRAVNTKVPLRNVDYSRFLKGETIVDGGTRVVTGVLTMNCGHAPTEGYGTLSNRIEHYDNTCSVVANVAIGEHEGEVWVAGALNPFATPEMVTKMLGCTLSGDWQPHPDRKGIREFIAALLVPVPGFAMARTEASVRYQEGALVASSVPVLRAEDAVDNPFKIKEALSVARLQERKADLSKQLRGNNV